MFTLRSLLENEHWDKARQKLKEEGCVSVTWPAEVLVKQGGLPNDILEALVSYALKYENYGVDITSPYCFGHSSLSWSSEYLKRFLSTVVRIAQRPVSLADRRQLSSMLARNNFSQDRLVEVIKAGGISSMDDLQAKREYRDILCHWEHIELRIRAAIKDGLTSSIKELPLLSLMIRRRYHEGWIRLVLKVYPDQVKVKDSTGRLPLHWAALHNGNVFRCISENEAHPSVVDTILPFYPEAATITDKKGFLPIELLFYSTSTELRERVLPPYTTRDAIALVHSAPEALVRVSTYNQMLPFMTAACSDNAFGHSFDRRMKGIKAYEAQKLTLIFCLIIQNPTVVEHGIRSTSHEPWIEMIDRVQLRTHKLMVENNADLESAIVKQSTETNEGSNAFLLLGLKRKRDESGVSSTK